MSSIASAAATGLPAVRSVPQPRRERLRRADTAQSATRKTRRAMRPGSVVRYQGHIGIALARNEMLGGGVDVLIVFKPSGFFMQRWLPEADIDLVMTAAQNEAAPDGYVLIPEIAGNYRIERRAALHS